MCALATARSDRHSCPSSVSERAFRTHLPSFWLLDDPVDEHGGVELFLPSGDFTLPSVPGSLADDRLFCERTIEFVTARNERIQRRGH